jgi:uncharacterized membrane protein YoaK (UPF0700 family)
LQTPNLKELEVSRWNVQTEPFAVGAVLRISFGPQDDRPHITNIFFSFIISIRNHTAYTIIMIRMEKKRRATSTMKAKKKK